MIYLDYNATSPIRPEVKQAFIEALDLYGNPSSVHGVGRMALQAIEKARAAIAAYCGVQPRNVIFTSGATEANHMALRGVPADVLLVPQDEHDCVLAAATQSDKPVLWLPLTKTGDICPDAFARAVATCEQKGWKPLLTIMKVNNETGRIKDFADKAMQVRSLGGWVHSDSVQALGKISFDSWIWQSDLITLSSHKVGGLKGVGVLILKDKIPFKALTMGGGQEFFHRAGTQHVAGIVALGRFFELLPDILTENEQYQTWQAWLLQAIKAKNSDIICVASNQPKVSNILNIIHPRISSENQVIMADLHGFCISAGSACSSGKIRVSHVLRSYGYADEDSLRAVRVSFGYQNTFAEIEKFADFYSSF